MKLTYKCPECGHEDTQGNTRGVFKPKECPNGCREGKPMKVKEPGGDNGEK